MPIALDDLPAEFHDVPWVDERSPGAPGTETLDGGANCQVYAYAVLRHFGWEIPPLRSSDLWEDTDATAHVDGDLEPFDLLLFGRTAERWGAHVGVYVGDGAALHLCREVGHPVVWALTEFAERPRYAVMTAKRPLRRVAQDSS